MVGEIEHCIPGKIGDRLDAFVVGLDEGATIVIFNRFAEKLTGYSGAEVIGKNWFETFIPEGDVEEIAEVFKEVWNGEDPYLGNENPIRTKDGRELLLMWENFLLRDNDGTTRCIISIGHDLTNEK